MRATTTRLLALAFVAASTGTALAQEAFRPVAVPWVGTAPTVPHDAVAGQWFWMQAVARGACADTIQYRWDFEGDGTFDMGWTNAPSRHDLAVKHTYPDGGQTRLYVARVEARCGAAGEPSSADFYVRAHSGPTRGQRVNRAISNGLWYGHKSLSRSADGRKAWWGHRAASAALAQAMMNRGHRAGVSPDVSPYVDDAQGILHYLLGEMYRLNIAGLQQGEDPDVNGDGYCLYYQSQNAHGVENYTQGPVLEALASWGDMNYVAPADLGFVAEVGGRTIGEIVQNASEYFFWGMSEIPFDGGFAGGWTYHTNDASQIDTSQVGWTAVGLFAAEENGGVQVPQWVKDRLLKGSHYMHSGRIGGQQGAYGYTTPTPAWAT